MRPLFELAAEYRAAADRLMELGVDDQTIADTLESLGDDLKTKVVNSAFVARNLDVEIDAIDAVIEGLTKRKKAKVNVRDRMYGYIQENMERANLPSVEVPEFRISLQPNPVAVHIAEGTELPAAYRRTIPASWEPDKVLIKQDLKEGRAIPGCSLTRSMKLVIR